MNKKTCICKSCGKSYELYIGEINRKLKKGTNFYCSLSCSGKSPRHNPYSSSEKNIQHLKKLSKNKGDELTPFRELCKRARSKTKGKNKNGFICDITPEYLKQLWEEQNGKCSWTGVSLVLPLSNGAHDKSNPNIIASLDRKNSDLGYVKGNVQFVMTPLNLAKSNYEDDVILNLIELIKES